MKIRQKGTVLVCMMSILMSTTMIITPVFSGPPYYHEEGNVNYPGSIGESVYTTKGIGVDDYITMVDHALIVRAMFSTPADDGIPSDWWAWNPDADIDGSGKITVHDGYIMGRNWGLNYRYSPFVTVSGETTVRVVAPVTPIEVGEQFTVDIEIENVEGLNTYEFTLSWNPGLLMVISIVDGGFLSEESFMADIIGVGYLYVAGMHEWTQSGSGVLATITFEGIGAGETTLDLSSRLFDINLYSMPHQDEEGTVLLPDTIPPVANAGPDQIVYEDILMTFDGSGSYDNVGIESYVWTFMDVSPQTLTGVNPTYTFTTQGIYTVTLDVSDAAGYHATDTVTITVLGPEDATQELIETIETWNLDEGIESSLTDKLENALKKLEQGKEDGAIDRLIEFKEKVEKQRGKKLTSDQADYLTEQADIIIYIIIT